MGTKYIGLDVETWTFEIEKVEFLLSLCDDSHAPDQRWALTSAATALCEKLRAAMEAKADELREDAETTLGRGVHSAPVPHRVAA